MTGLLRHVKRKRKRMQGEEVEELFLNISAATTANIDTYKEYVTYLSNIFTNYSHSTALKQEKVDFIANKSYKEQEK
ncbi:hypothetical protein BDB01DRAFT_798481 [Pilobolus umbonatus]|nr:hypothetical protein BDB01DRAFT_798481 [Pilobolus umbonatus]